MTSAGVTGSAPAATQQADSVQRQREVPATAAPAPPAAPVGHAHLDPVYSLDLAPLPFVLRLLEEQHAPHVLVSGGSSGQQCCETSGGQPGHCVT